MADNSIPIQQQQSTASASEVEEKSKWVEEVADPEEKGYGVRKIEVLSAYFTTGPRLLFFFFMFLGAYCYDLDARIRNVYQTQATSSYQKHSLLTTVNVLRSVIGAAAQPTYAKLSNVYGRMEIFTVAIMFYVVGTIIESQAYDVQRFAGGAILYEIGYTGMVLTLALIGGDFSLMNWRLLSIFVPFIPSAINSWISGDVTQHMVEKWSWGIGMWAIITPVAFLPLYVLFYYQYWRAKKAGHFDQFNSYQSDYQKHGLVKVLIDLFWKLDIIGIILFIAFMALILVPLTLAGGVQKKWDQAHIIAPLVVGFCCIPAFLYWESVAKQPIIPFRMLKDRGVWAAMIVAVMVTLVYAIQGDYLYTVLVVSVNESVKSATRIISLRGFLSIIVGLIFSFIVAKLRRVKPFIVTGTCLWMVAMGIMYHFRGGESSHSGIIGAMVLLGIAGGLFTHPTEVSLQACVNHDHMATATSMYLAFRSIGSSVGSSISGAIWTQTLPKFLHKQFNDPQMIKSIYGDPMTFIKKFKWGSPQREAVVEAYRQTQRILLITSLCMTFIFILSSLFLRDKKLESVQTLKNVEESENEQEEAERKSTPFWKKIFQVETR
ncbi:hypothetical protein TRICI_003119 [Trichomonascus ciferrii]|uniref:Major facilitator superfamily (MFS) profile domain-containing protein n=1 Tax=Trichomonascus ciferrii TaxID=44093 RepID=A0A642V9X6_9ASCO|nr:hypothetical protein TRICI_003119 [Trichomonascus ciferrii]